MASLSKEEAEGFFSNLVDPEPQDPTPTRKASIPHEAGMAMEQISRNTNWNEGVEKLVKQNMLVGNLPGAIDCCLRCGRSVNVVLTP